MTVNLTVEYNKKNIYENILTLTEYTKAWEYIWASISVCGGRKISTRQFALPTDLLEEFKFYLKDHHALNINYIFKTETYELKAALVRNRKFEEFNNNLLKFPYMKGKAPFEDFQKEDISKAVNQNRFLFGWGTGTGKSYALSYLIQNFINKNITDKFILFTTKVGCLNLKEEILKFTNSISPEEIISISSVNGLKDRLIFKKEYKVVILNYSSYIYIAQAYAKLKNPKAGTKFRSCPIPISEWLENKPGVMLLDESHSISNPKSLLSQGITMLCKNNNFKYVYLFTGTFANKFEQMYAQLNLLDSKLVYNFKYPQWLSYYNELGMYNNPYIINPMKWRQDRLKKLNDTLFQKYGVKRNSKDVLDIKETLFVPPYKIDMSVYHKKIYQKFVEEYFEILRGEATSSRTKLSTMVKSNIMAFQACVDNPLTIKNNPRYEDLSIGLQEMINSFDMKKHWSKFDYLKEIVEDKVENENIKGIIWYDHPLTGEFLNNNIKTKHYFVYSGMKDMHEVINKFKQDKDKGAVLIASLRVMNTSVTIIEAKYNLWVERTYSPKVYEQALGRIARIGQQDITTNYVLMFDKSLDILQNSVLEKGQLVMDKLMVKEFMTVSDWGKLFSGVLSEDLI